MADINNPAGPPTIFCSSCGVVMEHDARFCSSCGAANPHAPAVVSAGSGARRTDHIKYRNMWVQVLLAIITLGIYTIYWFHVTLGELYRANGAEDRRRWLWTILYIIPIAQFFAYWHQGYEYDKFVNGKFPGIVIFVLWIVFGPAVWFLLQRDLNAAAKATQR
ncbi:MAG: DUF4234 domain-containing protein [Chloroflexi bacterium]|nr:DUF4234 domain-containing protein [Chloroflexota bacterium]